MTLPYFKWGHLTQMHTQNKIQRAGFNYSVPHPSPWHVISCHFYRWLWGYPGLTWWGIWYRLAMQWHFWSCHAVGLWSRAWVGVGRAWLLALGILPAALRRWVPVPAWQGWGSCSLQERPLTSFSCHCFCESREGNIQTLNTKVWKPQSLVEVQLS